ncbi:uncharacterized protein LOC143238578 [Tachypleus tridentatus]|uniref:uncharacterized protein LOC143238578 n=1 Tax=Tachypleus tridentatus TaxID=6853 RepID=UPI003FD0B482
MRLVLHFTLLLWVWRPLRSEFVLPNYQQTRSFRDTLNSVVLDMTRQYFAPEDNYVNDVFYDMDHPELRKADPFLHGHIPNTGYNNREDIIIENIYEENLTTDASPRLWRYVRFNNSDFILSVGNDKVFLWEIDYIADRMSLNTSTAILSHTTKNSIILDSIVFVKTYEHLQILTVGILEASEYVAHLTVYKMVNGYSNQVLSLKLGDTPFKLGHVSSQFDSAIILIYNSSSSFKIQYLEKGIGCWKNVIKIWLHNPIDLETFLLHGLGYVAVANSSTCFMFKLDWFLRSHTLLESFHAEDIRDLHSFRVGFEHFFIIISSQEQHLLVWRRGEFRTRQFLKFLNVVQIYTIPVSSCRDDAIAVLFQDTIPNQVSLLVFQSRENRLIMVSPQIFQSFREDIQLSTGSITSFMYKKTVYLLAINKRKGPQLFSLHTSLKPLPDPMISRLMELENFINHVEIRFQEYERNWQRLLHVFEYATVNSENVLIFKHQIFYKMNVLNKIVGALKLIENFHLDESRLTFDLKWTIDLVARNLNDVEQNLEAVSLAVKDVALLDETTLMTGTNAALSVQTPTLGAVVVDVVTIAQTDMIILQKSIYRSDKPEIIKGERSFVSPITVRRSVEVRCCVNNFDLDRDILSTDKDQASTAYYYMMMPLIIQNELHIAGRVNNVYLLEDLVTLHNKHQIKAHVIMKDEMYIYGDLTAKIIDRTDVKEMKRFSLTANAYQIMFSKKFVQDVLVQNVTISGVFNDVDLNMLGTNIVRIDMPTIFSGKKTFKEIFSVGEKLFVGGMVDALKLPTDLFTSNSSQNIIISKTFQGPLSINNIYVNGFVDKLNTSDAVTLTKEDFLFDKIFAQGIEVEKDIIVGRFVDTVNISILPPLMKKEDNLFGNAIFLAAVIVEKNLDVEKKINELDVERTHSDAIFKTEMVEIYSFKIFDALMVQSIRVNPTSGFDIEYFMLASGNRKIRGTKFFDETIFLDLRSEINIVDEVELNLLEAERVSRSFQNMIQGRLYFKNLLVKNVISETIDDINIQNAVLVSLPQVITKKTFKANPVVNRRNEPHLSVQQVRVMGDVKVETTVDAVDITELLRKRITTSSIQDILVKTILGDNNAVLIEAERVNNFDLLKLSKNIMSLGKIQTIFEKNFEGEISIWGNIKTSGVSSVKLDLVNSNAIQLNGDQTLSNHYTFLDFLPVVERLNVRKLINNIDLTDLVQDSVMVEGNHILTEPVRFQNVFHTEGSINAIFVNGVHLSHKLLTQTSPQVITGVFVFERGLGLSSNLLTSRLLNGIDVSYLNVITMKEDQNDMVLGSLVFRNEVEIKNNPLVLGLVNGIKLSWLKTEAVSVNESDHITNSKSIANETFVKANLITNLLNDMDLEQFIVDVIRVIGEQEIPTLKIFTEEVVVLHYLQVLGPASVYTVNEIDLTRLARNAVYIDKSRKIEDVKVFRNFVEVNCSITVHGHINNIDLSIGAITVNGTGGDVQRIYGEKLFTNVFFKEHVTVAETVNNRVLEKYMNDTLLKTGNQTASGHKMIMGKILCEKDLHLLSVNNMNLRESVNLYTNQVISGQLKFLSGVKYQNLYVQGLINEVSVLLMVKEVVYLETTQYISAEFFFADLLVKGGLIIGKTIDHVDLDKLDKAVVHFDISFKAKTRYILDDIRRQQLIGDYLWDVLEESLYHLDKFVFYTSLNITGDFVDVLPQTTDFSIVTGPNNGYYGKAYNFVMEHPKLLYLDTISTSATIRRISLHILQRVFMIYVAAPQSTIDTVIKEIEHPVASLGQGILDIAVVNGDSSYSNIIVLDVEGTCKIYVFGSIHGSNDLLMQVASFHAGKESTGMTAFRLNQEEVHIAVARKFPSPYTQGSSLLFKFNKDIELVQEIAAPASDDVVYFKHCSKHYLAFTNAIPVHEALEPNSVQVYRSCGCLETPFRLHQKIYFDNPMSLEVFQLGRLHEVYMIISNSTVAEFYHLQGERGFVSNTTLVSDDIRDVKPFVAHGELYVAVVQGKIAKTSTVLKAEMKGSTVPSQRMLLWP